MKPTPEAGIPFEDAPSATPDSPTRTALRIDPYWAALWGQSSDATWVSRDIGLEQDRAGVAAVPSWLNVDPESSWERLGGNGRGQDKRFAALAVLDSWRTVTAEQLAAISGVPELATGMSGTAGDLFVTGLADVGLPNTPMRTTRASRRVTVYRPSQGKVFQNDLFPRLTFTEAVQITGDKPWSSGRQFDRHNILATELALRVAEFCEIGAVAGEKFSTIDALAHSGCGFEPLLGSQRAADATLIRADGARIAVELTASFGDKFDHKVRAWAKLLSERRMADSGLVVLFVVAPRAGRKDRTRDAVIRLRDAVHRAARAFPGIRGDMTIDRMFVASWRDWFPAPGRIDPSFFTLDAWRPNGDSPDRWQPASMLDPIDVPFDSEDPDWFTAAIDNFGILRQTPPWLRNGHHPEIWPLAIKARGYTGIPVPPPSRPETFKNKTLGAAHGVSGQARPPRRVLLVR